MAAETPVCATEENWAFPPPNGWTFDQVKELDLPFDWELVDGMIVVRGRTMLWHDTVLNEVERLWEQSRPEQYAVVTEACVMFDVENVRIPDVIVYDPTGLNLFETECLPVGQVRLAVEVVSPGSRKADRFLKPTQYSQAKVPYYWRIELERDRRIAVHEYWLNPDTRSYIPRPERPCTVAN